jgi:hypothetical protein
VTKAGFITIEKPADISPVRSDEPVEAKKKSKDEIEKAEIESVNVLLKKISEDKSSIPGRKETLLSEIDTLSTQLTSIGAQILLAVEYDGTEHDHRPRKIPKNVNKAKQLLKKAKDQGSMDAEVKCAQIKWREEWYKIREERGVSNHFVAAP